MFVLQLTSSNRDPLIVRSTIDLAHALEMEVTAEGVETPAALALLSVMKTTPFPCRTMDEEFRRGSWRKKSEALWKS